MPLVISFKTLTQRNPPPSLDSCLHSAAIKVPACYQNTTEPQIFCWHKEFLSSVTKRCRAEPFHSCIKHPSHPPRASLRKQSWRSLTDDNNPSEVCTDGSCYYIRHPFLSAATMGDIYHECRGHITHIIPK